MLIIWLFPQIICSLFFNSETEAEIRRGRDNTMKMEIPCQKIWLPGRYLLLVLDTADGKVRKTCFALNDRLETVDVSGSPVCDTFGLEDVVVNLIQSVDEEWVGSDDYGELFLLPIPER